MPPGCAGVPARIRAILRVPGSAGVPNREPRTRNREPRTKNQEPGTENHVPGTRSSRTENQEPRTENHVPPGCAGVPNREPGTENREPRAPWERRRPEPRTKNQELRTTCILGARASSPACGDCGLKPSLSTWKPLRGYGGERPWERGRPARMRRLRAEALAEHLEAPAGLWRRASLGARASRPHAETAG